ncbi:MAG: HEAT repeat domain-containing protein [Elusimicrobiota bacterium]
MVREALPSIRAEEKDLSVRPDRWPTRLTLDKVERLLVSPLSAPGLEGTGRDMLSASSLTELLHSAAETLGVPLSEVVPSTAPSHVERLMQAISSAQPLLDRSVGSLSAQERRRALAAARSAVLNESPEDGSEAAEKFDLASLLQAAFIVARQADETAAGLKGMESSGRSRSEGVLVSGAGDDVYTAEDLKGVSLLVDLGGRSRYEAAPASADEGRIRVVIDLSAEVVIDAPDGAPASGVFGIGLLYLPNAGGTKTLRGGDIAFGAGLFGVGGMIAEGPLFLDSRRFGQGAGAFGAGLLLARGDASRLTARLSAQGFGSTKGAGLFVHHGSGTVLTCGLHYPDPREGLAFISLCQGAGLGPRAFAAGGVGLAALAGDGNRLDSGYMAQGLGYWHGLGALFVQGNGNRLQARRYAHGAGVHTAVGLLSLSGDRNRVVTWGVGPGFGWDYGVGWLLSRGDGNDFSSEWASARGDVNGHGFAVIQGGGNRIALADMGSGAMKRNAPSYGVVAVEGGENRIREVNPDAWGFVRGPASEAMEPEKPEWPSTDRAPFEEADRERLAQKLSRAEKMDMKGRLRAWLSVLSDPGLDGRTPLETAGRVLEMDRKEGAAHAPNADPEGAQHSGASAPAAFASLVSADRFDELAWIRLFLAAFGTPAAAAVNAELQTASGMRKTVLAGMLSLFRTEDAAPAAVALLADPDWRTRRAALLSLGGLFSRERGEEPGRLRMLEEASAFCLRKSGAGESAWLGAKRLTDLYAMLAVDPGYPSSDAVELLLASGGNVFDRFSPGAPALNSFAELLYGRAGKYGPALAQELAAAQTMAPDARKAVLPLLRDPEPEVAQAALTALAQMGYPEDSPALAAFMDSPWALLREAAAAGLARMGLAAEPEIQGALKAAEPGKRALAVLAAAQSADRPVLELLRPAFRDSEPEVRRTAAASLFAFQAPFQDMRKEFFEELDDLSKDPSEQVKAAALQTRKAILGR